MTQEKKTILGKEVSRDPDDCFRIIVVDLVAGLQILREADPVDDPPSTAWVAFIEVINEESRPLPSGMWESEIAYSKEDAEVLLRTKLESYHAELQKVLVGLNPNFEGQMILPNVDH